ncbi:hypothetical protein halTADL_2884 [Halohasta litchfieldiae]|jgi:hypothetical protein|uniref:Halobacterial output domain-containing protein n=1 Tax=Halohasta litchfieldiae TaxID=1073996 RepID=A0A1H6YJN7_9EURY|nr:hypothetical protein halTADL_2884 [Halohasta litchfieldiae]SEJ37432.1 hypothetical protein SAMN05444271_1615 [Halohasta litchfieldiae]
MIEDLSPTPADSTGTQTHSFTPSADQSIDVSIIRAVASVSGVDPLSLEPRLYDVVDPDALKRLLNSASSEMRITFLFGVYEVSVTGDGHIFVRDDTTAVQ